MVKSRRARIVIAFLFMILVLGLAGCGRELSDVGGQAGTGDSEVGGGMNLSASPGGVADTSPRLTPEIQATASASPAIVASPTLALPTTEPVPATPAPTETPVPPVEDETTSGVTPAPAETPPEPTATAEGVTGERIHIVAAGENLYRIGLQYGVSWVAIAEYNGITNPDQISVGQELRIPLSPTATPESATPEAVIPAGEAAIASASSPGADTSVENSTRMAQRWPTWRGPMVWSHPIASIAGRCWCYLERATDSLFVASGFPSRIGTAELTTLA